METKVNVVLLGALLVTWATLTLAEPAAAIDADRAARGADGLAALEDAFATHRDDPRLARELAEQYLALDRPQLAIAALGAASADVRQEPATLHRLAEAYEATGRMDDALATAQLARAHRASRWPSSGATPGPADWGRGAVQRGAATPSSSPWPSASGTRAPSWATSPTTSPSIGCGG